MCVILDGLCYQLLQIGLEWDPTSIDLWWDVQGNLWQHSLKVAANEGAGELWLQVCLQVLFSLYLPGGVVMYCFILLRYLPACDEGVLCSAKNENVLFKIVLENSFE